MRLWRHLEWAYGQLPWLHSILTRVFYVGHLYQNNNHLLADLQGRFKYAENHLSSIAIAHRRSLSENFIKTAIDSHEVLYA